MYLNQLRRNKENSPTTRLLFIKTKRLISNSSISKDTIESQLAEVLLLYYWVAICRTIMLFLYHTFVYANTNWCYFYLSYKYRRTSTISSPTSFLLTRSIWEPKFRGAILRVMLNTYSILIHLLKCYCS